MKQLKSDLRQFDKERNWSVYHSPKNLSMALAVEVAELMEIFQWMTEKESQVTEPEVLIHLKEEIGDVQIYLTLIADRFNLCPIEEAKKKLKKNKIKYPVLVDFL